MIDKSIDLFLLMSFYFYISKPKTINSSFSTKVREPYGAGTREMGMILIIFIKNMLLMLNYY